MPSIIGWIKNGRKGKNLAYMPASYPSERVAYGNGTVKDALDELNANTYGTTINITAGTPYTTTKDGYVRFAGSSTQTVLCSVNSYPVMQIPASAGGANLVMSLFVRKGMTISMTNGNAVFLPFE